MGVGRNMAKSIGWWMNRAGLARRPARTCPIELTSLGQGILNQYPYFSGSTPWWFIHLELTLGKENTVFPWFFQNYREKRFTRESLEGALVSYLETRGEKIPTAKSLYRDIAVLLQSYARPIPALETDPEDNLDCPLRSLGLLVHRTDVGVFERRATKALIPASVIAAALELSQPADGLGDMETIPLDFSGPIRKVSAVFGMDSENMVEHIIRAVEELGLGELSLNQLSGQRSVILRKRGLAGWLNSHVASLKD